jgi:putative endonuclease
MVRNRKRDSQRAGQVGEHLAQGYLEAMGYRIVDTNVHFGKTSGVTGELDIVAWEGGTLCFIEVKTRRATTYEQVPAAAVTPTKQRQLTRLATLYAIRNGLLGDGETCLRFDIVSVILPEREAVENANFANIQLIRGAFAAAEED